MVIVYYVFLVVILVSFVTGIILTIIENKKTKSSDIDTVKHNENQVNNNSLDTQFNNQAFSPTYNQMISPINSQSLTSNQVSSQDFNSITSQTSSPLYEQFNNINVSPEPLQVNNQIAPSINSSFSSSQTNTFYDEPVIIKVINQEDNLESNKTNNLMDDEVL